MENDKYQWTYFEWRYFVKVVKLIMIIYHGSRTKTSSTSVCLIYYLKSAADSKKLLPDMKILNMSFHIVPLMSRPSPKMFVQKFLRCQKFLQISNHTLQLNFTSIASFYQYLRRFLAKMWQKCFENFINMKFRYKLMFSKTSN